jgi:hypothetical protein
VQPQHSDPAWQASYWNNTDLSGPVVLNRSAEIVPPAKIIFPSLGVVGGPLAERFGLDMKAVFSPDGQYDESHVTVEKSAALRVFDAQFPIPAHALHSLEAIEQAFKVAQGLAPAAK